MDDNQQDKDNTDRSDLVSEDGKNSKSVLCQRCGSKVLCPGMAAFAEKEVWMWQKAIYWTDSLLVYYFLSV